MRKLKRKLLSEISCRKGDYRLSPDFASLVITHRCNFHCQACSIWKKDPAEELSTEQWLGISKDLRSLLDPGAFIEINGGEPLMRSELVPLLISDLKKHFSSITLNSNGSLLDEKMAEELERAGLDSMKISLYSLDPGNHDSLRGFPGSHEKALRAIRLLANSKITPEVGILITSKNINGVPELISSLQKHRNVRIILQPLDEKIESPESKDQSKNEMIDGLWPNPDSVNNLFDWLAENRKQVKNSLAALKVMRRYYLDPESVLRYRCFAGQRSLVIDPQGNISFCFKRPSIGNATERNISEILESFSAKNERQAIRKCKKYCRIVGCNFSRGIEEFLGDFFRG